jgi:hypothetical protein
MDLMGSVARALDSWLGATVDTILGTITFFFILTPVATQSHALVGSPLSPSQFQSMRWLFALGASYPVVAGDWSLGRLATYALVLFFTGFVLNVAAKATVAALGLSAVSEFVVFVALTLSYTLSYVVVFRADGPNGE